MCVRLGLNIAGTVCIAYRKAFADAAHSNRLPLHGLIFTSHVPIDSFQAFHLIGFLCIAYRTAIDYC